MKKATQYAAVNVSYTSFFILFVFVSSWFFASVLPETRGKSLVVLALYALLLYFMWDFIKQLYSAGQALILYTITFIILPVVMNFAFNSLYGRIGLVVLVSSYFFAGLAELAYEGIVKPHLPRRSLKQLVLIDNKIDRSMIRFSRNQLYLTNYRGFAFALALIAGYTAIAFALFHK